MSPPEYDPLIVDALIQRYRIPAASSADRAAAVQQLAARGFPTHIIAARLYMSCRQVERLRTMKVVAMPQLPVNCGCPDGHEYDTKRGYYNRNRDSCKGIGA